MILGITGGIASGKSTVSDYLREKGITIIDADAISREITQKGKSGAKAIEKNFGSEFFTGGELDRKKLSLYCFSSPEKTSLLNGILHPLIFDEITLKLNSHKNERLTVLDAPLLIEAGLNTLCDKILVVVCDIDERIKRVELRSGLTRDEALSRINRQISDSERLKYADFVIDNNGAIEETLKQVENVIEILTCENNKK